MPASTLIPFDDDSDTVAYAVCTVSAEKSVGSVRPWTVYAVLVPRMVTLPRPKLAALAASSLSKATAMLRPSAAVSDRPPLPLSNATTPVKPLYLLISRATFSRVAWAVSFWSRVMSICTPLIARVAVAVVPMTVVGAEPSRVSALALAVTLVSADAALIAAAMAIADAAFFDDSALSSEKMSSLAVAPRMAMPLIFKSPEFSVLAAAALADTARLSLVTPEMPRW